MLARCSGSEPRRLQLNDDPHWGATDAVEKPVEDEGKSAAFLSFPWLFSLLNGRYLIWGFCYRTIAADGRTGDSAKTRRFPRLSGLRVETEKKR